MRIARAFGKRGLWMVVLMLLSFACFSGIYRHDVPKQRFLDLAQQPQFDCVGKIYQRGKDSSKFISSCVLIDSLHILTAAHVFYHYDVHPALRGSAEEYYVVFADRQYPLKRLMPHEAYTDSLRTYDIALATLQEPVKDITPAILNHRFNELHAKVVGVGYGSSGPCIQRPGDSIRQRVEKLAGENVIDCIGGTKVNGRPSWLCFDFDDPERIAANPMGTARPRPLEYMCAGGDSGGGLFRRRRRRWELIGLCHQIHAAYGAGTGYYGSTTEWARVAVFMDWIRAHIRADR
jgi:hypothetical protein